MSNFVKDLAVLLYSAGEELEKKAQEYKETRETRQDEFEQKFDAQKEELKAKCQDDFQSMKGKFSEVTGKLGLASKSEIDELKTMLAELSNKIDNLNR